MPKRIYFILFVVGVVLFLILRLPYRNYIYAHQIFDFHIADSAPNFLAPILFLLFKKWQKPERKDYLYLIPGTVLGLLVYEFFIQKHIYDAVIDMFDVIATFLGTGLGYCIIRYVGRFCKLKAKSRVMD